MIDAMITETKGNLFESSIVSKLAEQFGLGLGMNGYLRNVDNDLSYVNPNTLANASTNPEALTKEPHNFSRVMSGALYRIFAEIYTAKGKNVASAKLARDFVRDSLFRCMKLVPAVPGFFTAFAKVFCDLGKTINPEFSSRETGRVSLANCSMLSGFCGGRFRGGARSDWTRGQPLRSSPTAPASEAGTGHRRKTAIVSCAPPSKQACQALERSGQSPD